MYVPAWSVLFFPNPPNKIIFQILHSQQRINDKCKHKGTAPSRYICFSSESKDDVGNVEFQALARQSDHVCFLVTLKLPKANKYTSLTASRLPLPTMVTCLSNINWL